MAQNIPESSGTTEKTGSILSRSESLLAGSCLAAAIVLWAVYTLPWSFAAQLGDDTVVFSYIAQRMLAGDILYLDAWDHKGPLIFMLDAMGLWLGGGSYGGIKVVEFVLMAAAVTLLYLALKPSAGKAFAALVPLVITASIRVPLSEGNFTEEYAIFLQAAAIFCILRLEDQACRRPALCAFLIGLAGACAFFLRANLIGLWLVLGLYWAVKAVIGKDIRGFVKNYVWAMVPVVLMTAAFAAYFGWYGAMSDFVEGFIFHNIRYSQEVSMPLWAKAAKMLALGQGLYPFLPLCLVGLVMLAHGGPRRRYPLAALFVPLWLAVEIVLSSPAGYPFPHYVITWLIPMAGLAVLVVCRLAMRLTGSLERPSAACLAILAVVAVGSVITALPAFTKATQLYGQRNSMTAMTKYIAENSKEGQTVYFYESFDAKNDFFGSKCLSPLFFADRKLPTPYVYSSFYLPGNERFRQKMVDALYDGWMRSPPALVIFLPKKEDSFWFLVDSRIDEMVKAGYHQVAELDGFVIYKPNAAN